MASALKQQPETAPRRGAFSSAEVFAAELNAMYGHLSAERIIDLAINDLFAGSITAVSSFGADSAVLLKMIAECDAELPVAFLDTGKHFGETLDYRDALVDDLGLSGLTVLHPKPDLLATNDPTGKLHRSEPDRCCDIRKVEPMARAIEPFDAWFTGRKRHQNTMRDGLDVFEAVGDRIRINPLARWTTSDLADYMREHDLRTNPLVAFGYLSIGCFPCTQPVGEGDDPRAGRWAGQAKTECGIHLGGLQERTAANAN